MWTEKDKEIFLAQREGYEFLRKFEIDTARKSTFAQRLNAFLRILAFSKYLPKSDVVRDESHIRDRWLKVRARYEELSQ